MAGGIERRSKIKTRGRSDALHQKVGQCAVSGVFLVGLLVIISFGYVLAKIKGLN